MEFAETRLTASIGSEISGLDLARDLSPDLAAALRARLIERAVLVFRDQHPSPEAHLALGEAWGRLAPRHPLYPHVEGHDRIMVIRNDAETPPENETWHSDLSFRAEPPFAALLHGVIIPEAGGDTLWADMRAAHDMLSEPMRAFLAGLEAEHSQEKGFAFLRGSGQTGREAAFAAQDRAAGAARHPVILHHPASGRPALYVNEAFTTRILGLAPAESDALLAHLCGLARHPRVQLRVRWRPGTLVIWDNWATQHYACGDHYPAIREVHRVTVLEDRLGGGLSGRPGLGRAA